MNNNQDWFEDYYGEFWALKNPPRNSQIEIIKEFDEALESGYENIIINAGVGIGKSAIAHTLLSTYNSGYICTENTNLQTQYINDFPDIVELKGRRHYCCHYNSKSCNNCYIQYLNKHGTFESKLAVLNEHGRTFIRYEGCSDEKWYDIVTNLKLWSCSDCEYQLAIKKAQYSPYVVANYYSLYTNSKIIERLRPREIILFDEAHNLEKITMDIVEFSFNPDEFYELTDLDVFDESSTSELADSDHWAVMLEIKKETIIKKRNEYQNLLDNQDIYFNKTYDETALKSIINEYNMKLSQLDYNLSLLEDGMYVQLPAPNNRELYSKNNNIIFKPVFGESYVHNFLDMGGTRVFLTGTLPMWKMYAQWIGLHPNNIHYIYKKSPYPVENRPIVYYPIDNFNGRKNKEGTYRWMKFDNILKIKNLLLKHDSENVVIHTTSNDQTEWLYNNLNNEFDCVIANGNNRNEIISDFKKKDSEYNILIGPKIKEGVDFKGNSCTVQMILKLPRPPYDGVVQERKKQGDSEFMNYFTAINLEQAYGRGVRAEDDECTMYILDNEFKHWFKGNRYNVPGKEYLSKYFREAINWNP